ncbi:MAG: ABC-F family ATP-binding cassette domain-containing protein [Pseudorhodoplanes sp.]
MLAFEDLSIRVAGRLLLENATARIPTGARVGLVGRNGTGKTTLFNVIAGELASENGHVEMSPRWTIGRLAQEAPDGPQNLIDTVLSADKEREALLAEAETATDPQRIADIHIRLVDIDAHSAPARVAAILAGLGFSAEAQLRPIREFSGGWRMRVALASVLFLQPDLLLLDEPTNYLDLEGTLWLEEHLARYPKSLIVISHDRDLLDHSVDHILHLSNARLTLYRGNYTSFARQRAEQQALDAKAVKKQEAQRKHLQAFVDRFKAKASKAKQAQSRVKMLAKLTPLETMVDDDVRPITFPTPEKLLSPPILALDDVAVGYEPGKPVLRKLTLRIDNDDRIALLGSNGNGKSTFVKLVAQRLAAETGNITRADKLKVAYFAQHQLDELDLSGTPYTHVRELMRDAPEAKVRARVGAIGFSGATADTSVTKLSGGEKARLMLGLATFNAPHLIILDEPTNHLDIDSRGALIEAINDFPGAVILVSHDRYLLDACADRLWLVAHGGVAPFEGDLDDYQRRILSDAGGKEKRERKSQGGRADARRSGTDRRAEAASYRQEAAHAEAEIGRLTREIERLDAALADGGLFTRDPAKAAAISKARAEAADALAKAEESWLAASAAYEGATA